MEKEKIKSTTLGERISNVGEIFKEYSYPVNFWYEDSAPHKEEGILPLQLKESEVETIRPLLEKIFGKEIEISVFFLMFARERDSFRFGIENGLGMIGKDKWFFEYLVTQDCEFSEIEFSCKDEFGKGLNQEICLITNFSKTPEESQKLISSILDIVEDRMV